jgi:hypothetical protein
MQMIRGIAKNTKPRSLRGFALKNNIFTANSSAV